LRITNNILSQNLLRNLESAQGRMDQLQNQLSSGLRINRPSDDPVGIQNALALKSNISNVEQWKNNADRALEYMNTTDSTLGGMTSMLQRVRELTLEGANGSLTVDDKAKLALEIDQIAAQIHLTANTQVGSKYIFSGTATDQELQKWVPSTDPDTGEPIKDPITGADTGIWQTQGNDQDVKFEVGNNVAIAISVNGQTLFGADGTTPPGIFETLSKLSNALKSKDADGNSIDSEGYPANAAGHRLDAPLPDGNPIDSEGYYTVAGYSTGADGNLTKTDYHLDDAPPSGAAIDSQGYHVDLNTGARIDGDAGGAVPAQFDLSSVTPATTPNTSIQNALGNLDANISNVVDLRADLGARTNRLTALQSQLDSSSINLQTNLSSVQDADMAKTITDFTNQQNVYKAALAVGAKIIQPSLVDFMH